MLEEQLTVFDRYELLELIATGGMAQVYRARLRTPQGTNKEVVVKKVLSHLSSNQEFINMFIDEARISMPLNHANIVQVFDFGQVGNDYFMVMEYVHGHNLETILARIRDIGAVIPIPVCLFVASEVAKGLDYAHRHKNVYDQHTGIIHRDVSPQNILVGFQGCVKLTDFGIAKAKSRIHQTRHGIIRGKACYLSPEQAECGILDGRADQFSLAVVLFEMLTGVRPFEGKSELETLEKVRSAKTQAPSSLSTEVPPEVDQVVMKALSRDPADRFESAGSFKSSLYGILRESAPNFTSSDLSDWLSNLIPARDKIARSNPQEIDTLGSGKMPKRNSKLCREDILRMNTVVIKKGSPDNQQPKRSRASIFLVFTLVLLIGTGVAAIWKGWPNLNDLFNLENPNPKSPSITNNLKSIDQPLEARVERTQQAEPANIEESPKQKTKPTRYGTLHLNADPWALVELDGKRLERHTPLFNVRVRAGKHSLRFFNPEIKLEKTISVWVFPERSKTVSVRLTDP